MKRRPKGEGSLFYWKKRGQWVARITMPDGRTKVKYTKLQIEAKDWLLTTRNQLKDGMLPSNDKITVSDYMTSYMDIVGKNTLRPSTQEMIDTFLRCHIIPGLGKIKLKDLRP